MRPFLLITIVLSTMLFAAFNTKNHYAIQKHIAKSLDIPQKFFHTKKYYNYKKKFSVYKRLHVFDPKAVETYFIPSLVKIINAYNVPDVFLYMAMAESRFAIHAKSNKRAVGIWQFMEPTAKKYGLRVDRYVDERKDPFKATRAAIRYLKDLHKQFGKWYLAALAYNAGDGAVRRAIRKAGTTDLLTLIDEKKKYLPKESREYIYRIVMYAMMANDKEYRLNQDLAYIMTRGEDYDIMPVKVSGGEPLRRIAQAIKLRPTYLRSLNPHIKRGITPPDTNRYSIYIPIVKYKEFQKYYKPQHIYNGIVAYRVQKGDTLYTIARKYGVSLQTLKSYNHLSSSLLHPGQRLYIPLKKLTKMKRRVYRVQKGDTLSMIAKKFGVDPKKLKAWNDKKSSNLKIGEKLVVMQ
ncbi:lytic transglycosylase domain-containing protein [Nitratiruptor sp. YY09-18]|uniref:lytic transglycosylase domain-containing protein n=1 Tax=Nitratiruptor sp. YY09-18 TaxID=2724901 RepID=UPI0019166318|nr:lytic transglycosylase domain-containing protein [Nitratiruptor sp. YY09-18]BCD67991.1 membrane-bound lytic murein transglycosylase D [Nitratiruptor sp. YY09-18]